MFGKKNPPAAPGQGGPRIPSQRVMQLSSQGMSEPEIIRTLRSEGYSLLEVDRGMKDALRSGAGVQPQQPQPPGGALGSPGPLSVPEPGIAPPPGKSQ